MICLILCIRLAIRERQALQIVAFGAGAAARLHDELNETTFEWKPENAESWRRDASAHITGPAPVMEWDGLLIDRWREP